MNRAIEDVIYTLAGPEPVADPLQAIQSQAQSGRYAYFLAYADDGVIWGTVQNKQLTQSWQIFPDLFPQLRVETLWEARLFGENAEWLLWRGEGGWQAREIIDGQGAKGEALIESIILWGTDRDGSSQGPFTPMREADLGIRHAPPIKFTGRHQLRLSVKHYLVYDDCGAVYVKLTRLVNLTNNGGAK